MLPTNYTPESRLPGAVFAIGVVLFVLGIVGTLFDIVPDLPISGLGLQLDRDVELVGFAAVSGAVLGDQYRQTSSSSPVTVP